MGFLSGLLAPALGAVGNFFLPGIGGAVGTALGGMLGGSSSKGGGGGGSAATPQAAADPFASQRPQYQQQLQSMMTGAFNPTDPSYKWRMDQGLEGVNRGMAASGLLRSGNRMAELMNYGQQQASGEFQSQYARLANLAGANIGSTSTAAQMAQQTGASSSAAGQELGGMLGKGLVGLLGGGNTGESGTHISNSQLPPLTMPALNH